MTQPRQSATPGESAATQSVHDYTRIPAARRLYMTVTPRLIGEHGAEGVGMDREDVFGPVAYRPSSGDAIARGLLAEQPEPDRYRQHDLIRLHAAAQPEDPMTDTAQLLAIARYLIAGLKQAELALTPSHVGHLPSPDVEALDEEIRPAPFTDEAHALAWCAGHADDTAKIIRACAAHGMYSQVVQLVHLKWPAYLRLGVPRIEGLELALAASRELGDERAVAMFRTGWGALAGVGRYEEAIAGLREAEEIYARLGDLRGRAQALNSIGKVLRILGRFDEARQAHETALRWRLEIGYTCGVALSRHDLGRVDFACGRFESALALFDEAARVLLEQLPAEGRQPDLYDGGLAAIWAARCRGELGQTAAALEQLRRAEQGMIERGSVQGQATAAETAGHVHEAAGDRENALASYRRALDLFESADDQGVERVREHLAELTAG